MDHCWPLRKKFGAFGSKIYPSPSEGRRRFVIVIPSSRAPSWTHQIQARGTGSGPWGCRVSLGLPVSGCCAAPLSLTALRVCVALLWWALIDMRSPKQRNAAVCKLQVGYGQGCSRTEGTSEAAPEAVRQAVGGGCQSGWGRLPSVTNAIEAGTCHQGHWLGIGWAPPPPFQCIPCYGPSSPPQKKKRSEGPV